MKYIFLTLFLNVFSVIVLGQEQTFEYVYKSESDSSYNCYLKVIPSTRPVKALIIRDFSALPDINKKSPYQFTSLCAEKGIMTIFTVSSKQFPELFVSDSVISILDNLVSEVIEEYEIPENNLFIGGISASGTRALRYAQYCEQGKSKFGIKIKGVFAVDSPLDLARFYESVKNHKCNFKKGMLWEANLMTEVFPKLFSGAPENFEDEYENVSVFSHSDSLGGNAYFLKNVDLILYHEPDINWWLEERGATYYDINSFDIVAFALKLKLLGNENVKLVTTTEKGYDKKGNRNCHSWTIVDENELINWILNRIE